MGGLYGGTWLFWWWIVVGQMGRLSRRVGCGGCAAAGGCPTGGFDGVSRVAAELWAAGVISQRLDVGRQFWWRANRSPMVMAMAFWAQC